MIYQQKFTHKLTPKGIIRCPAEAVWNEVKRKAGSRALRKQ